jgi:hypothetical protein
MVQSALGDWRPTELDFLFIENVGNLVCPSSYELGEDLRVVLLSVTEGEDKPLKYPTIFNTADVAVITKMDLAEAVEFNRLVAHNNIQAVRPGNAGHGGIFEREPRSGRLDRSPEPIALLVGRRSPATIGSLITGRKSRRGIRSFPGLNRPVGWPCLFFFQPERAINWAERLFRP